MTRRLGAQLVPIMLPSAPWMDSFNTSKLSTLGQIENLTRLQPSNYVLIVLIIHQSVSGSAGEDIVGPWLL